MTRKSRIGTTLAVLPLAAAFGLFGCESAGDDSDPSSSSSALGAGAREREAGQDGGEAGDADRPEQELAAQKNREQSGGIENGSPPAQPRLGGGCHQLSGSIVLLSPLALRVSQ